MKETDKRNMSIVYFALDIARHRHHMSYTYTIYHPPSHHCPYIVCKIDATCAIHSISLLRRQMTFEMFIYIYI